MVRRSSKHGEALPLEPHQLECSMVCICILTILTGDDGFEMPAVYAGGTAFSVQM